MDLLQTEAEHGSWFHAYILISSDGEQSQKLINYIIAARKYQPVDISVVRPEDTSGKGGEIKVAEIKQLLHDVSLSPYGFGRLAIIYEAERLNQSASNMLLKTLEEPTGNTMFVLVAATETILPTILSRCRTIRIASSSESTPEMAISFIGSAKEGFSVIVKEIERIVKENQAELLLCSLETHFRSLLLSDKQIGNVRVIQRIARCRRRIRANANPRLVLENFSLFLAEGSGLFK